MGETTEMTEVKFYEEIADERLAFAVILSKARDKYVFCRHRDRETWEIPGGHRERGEDILETAKRELYEETGALEFQIAPVCVYSVTVSDHAGHGEESFGMLLNLAVQFFLKTHNLGKKQHTKRFFSTTTERISPAYRL